MRTIFITPLLWKRLNRAEIRRGEEGQAIILIAFVAIGMVAMVGLAIDSGLGYLESTRLQRAADAAALAGVIWLPDNRAVADARASLAAESNGIKVACYYNTSLADSSAYNQRCRRASYTTVTKNGPSQYYSMDTEAPQGLAIQYKVTLSKMQTRFFLGVLGFPAYPIVKTSTAEYFHRVKFGSSFNYFGSNGVLTDHYMRCDNMGTCGGTTGATATLNMRGATYQKYVVMRCEQPSPPSPCIGGFWGHMAGQDLTHSSGDAYNPIRDGANSTTTFGSNVTGFTVGSGSAKGSDCIHTNDPTTWFINSIISAPGTNCNVVDSGSATSGGFPIQNFDTHPDSPNGADGFGSEIVIDVDQAAIWSYTETLANTQNHTNLNVTIYDGAENEQGGNETFGTSDDYQPTGNNNNYGTFEPASESDGSGWAFRNVSNVYTNTAWSTKRLVCSPGTKALSGTSNPNGGTYNTAYCDSSTLSTPAKPTAPRANNWDPSKSWSDPATTADDQSTFFPDRNNFELTYNDLRTRMTLYGPPSTPAIPSIYGNVQGYKIGQMELTDMSVRSREIQGPIGCPQGGCSTNTGSTLPAETQRFCYFIFDDTKSFWDNTQFPDTQTEANKPPSFGTTTTKYFGPDYAYSTAPTTGANGVLRAANNRYAYVCPDNPNTTTNEADVRWNQLKGTPTARYGTMVDYDINNPGDRTIQKEILDPTTPNDISINPIADLTIGLTRTRTISSSSPTTTTITTTTYTTTITSNKIDPEAMSANIWDVSSTSNTGFQQTVDPNQDCRRSAVDMNPTTGTPGMTIDSLWGHNRIPFNMAYGDPLVNRAWITDTTWVQSTSPVITKPVAGNGSGALPANQYSSKIAGYYTLYYSFHGWRCEWDFDSNYTYDATTGRGNPLKDPTKMPSPTNPSLSLQERQDAILNGGNYGKFDKAFVEGHPGLDTFNYAIKVLQSDTTPTDCNIFRDFPGYTFTKTASTPPSCSVGSNTSGFDRDFGLQPYFHLTNVAWNPDGSGNIIPAPGFTFATAPVRAGSYLMHIQTFSGAAANRYSLKAEYENPKQVVYTTTAGTLTVTPVPSVYPLTTMTIYANAVNSSNLSQQDVIFDLAYIPPEYAGTQGIVQLWDAGDVSGALSVSILQPSTYGPKINTANSSNPANWKVKLGAAITTTISACPFTLSPTKIGTGYNCVYNSSQTAVTSTVLNNGSQFYNDQWIFLSFKIPSLSDYNSWKASCEVNGVPENLCYFFQIDYQLKTANARANDTTTWQLLVQGQPVHLVDNDAQP